jgi:hypothetical protein
VPAVDHDRRNSQHRVDIEIGEVKVCRQELCLAACRAHVAEAPAGERQRPRVMRPRGSDVAEDQRRLAERGFAPVGDGRRFVPGFDPRAQLLHFRGDAPCRRELASQHRHRRRIDAGVPGGIVGAFRRARS